MDKLAKEYRDEFKKINIEMIIDRTDQKIKDVLEGKLKNLDK